MSIIRFNTMDLGTYETDVVVSSINQSSTANNKPMIKITLSDGEESITALIFDTTKKDLAASGVEEGITAVVSLEVTDYKGNRSYKVVNINPVKLPEDELKQLIKMPPEDPAKLVSDILMLIKQSSGRTYDLSTNEVPSDDFSLTALSVRLITSRLKDFTKSSAAKTMHQDKAVLFCVSVRIRDKRSSQVLRWYGAVFLRSVCLRHGSTFLCRCAVTRSVRCV